MKNILLSAFLIFVCANASASIVSCEFNNKFSKIELNTVEKTLTLFEWSLSEEKFIVDLKMPIKQVVEQVDGVIAYDEFGNQSLQVSQIANNNDFSHKIQMSFSRVPAYSNCLGL